MANLASSAIRARVKKPKYQTLVPLSTQGRIGRLRYLVYSTGYSVVFGLLAGVAAILSTVLPATTSDFVFSATTTLAVGFWLMSITLLSIQRSHDFDTTGWLVLLLIVPLGVIFFIVIPGTRGPNRYGRSLPPNSSAVKTLTSVIVTFGVLLVLLAILTPSLR